MLEKLTTAVGVVFDMRGHPTDAGAQILPYLIDAAESDRWINVAKTVGPCGHGRVRLIRVARPDGSLA
jgi:hypothetical protein